MTKCPQRACMCSRQVLSAQVCAFANASCGSFQALTQRGYLRANIQNTGTVPADFTVSVSAPFQIARGCSWPALLMCSSSGQVFCQTSSVAIARAGTADGECALSKATERLH